MQVERREKRKKEEKERRERRKEKRRDTPGLADVRPSASKVIIFGNTFITLPKQNPNDEQRLPRTQLQFDQSNLSGSSRAMRDMLWLMHCE